MNNCAEKRWLRLKEATYYSCMGKSRLIDLALSGVIRGAKDPDNKRNDWIFDRLSIDSYREAQMPAVFNAKEKALEILRS